MNSLSPLTACLLLCSLISGCATLGGSTSAPAPKWGYASGVASVVESPVCETVLSELGEGQKYLKARQRMVDSYQRVSPTMDIPSTRLDQVLLVVCNRRDRGRKKVGWQTPEAYQVATVEPYLLSDLHLSFEPGSEDMLALATSLFWMAYPRYATSQYMHVSSDKLTSFNIRFVTDPFLRGMSGFYVSLLDKDKLVSELRALGVKQEMEGAFLANLNGALDRLSEMEASMDLSTKAVRREAWLELPKALYARTLDTRAQYKEVVRKHELLRAGSASASPNDATVQLQALLDLQREFLQACGLHASCLDEPIYHQLWSSAEPLLAATNQKSGLLMVKDVTFRRGRWDTFARRLDMLQAILVRDYKQRGQRHVAALRSGLPKQEVEALHPGPVLPPDTKGYKFETLKFKDLRFRDRRFERPADYLSALGAPYPAPFRGKVARLKPTKDRMVTVEFRGGKERYLEDYDCKTTNRVDRIDATGKFYYRESCKSRWTTRVIKPPASVNLPTWQADLLKPGDVVSGFGKEDGWLDTVTRSEEVVIRQGHPFKEAPESSETAGSFFDVLKTMSSE